MTYTDRPIQFHLSGYEIEQQIYQGARSSIYQGQRIQDQQPVIIKVSTQRPPTEHGIIRIQQDFEIGSLFHDPRIISYHALVPFDHGLAIIEEDCASVRLADITSKEGFPVSQFMKIAIQLAEGLHVIHRQDIIHKDVTPYNVLINPRTEAIKFIDFGIASRLRQEILPTVGLNKIEGTLTYISPEQTGRMNRPLDYRTDFYSLGVMFYELLCGQLPFNARDPMELVHCHIARMPVPPHEIKAEIPPAISEIILKLMAKNAENRYQSAFGLKLDLEQCESQLKTTGKIDTFVLAQHDVSGRFHIPQKLYGRESEIDQILHTYQRVCEGEKLLLLVAGYSGVGKTTLIHEIHKPVTKHRGYFIAGKFDQFQRNVPYFAFIQAFKAFVHLLLAENEEVLAQWKHTIQSAIGTVGKVLTDVIPELELVIGKQPEVPELDGIAAQNRFHYVLKCFLEVIAQKEHPLVLFLDDLQWADVTSLNLLHVFVMDHDIQHVLLIGAYRENEVHETHPLMLTLEKIEKEQGRKEQLFVKNLTRNDVTNLISETLGKSSSGSADLSGLVGLVYQKTQGNAFFTIQFLKNLYEKQLLAFDFGQQIWRWDIEKIKDLHITENVVELIASNVQKLPQNTQEILQLAACVGNTFDLKTLSIISKKEEHTVKNHLEEAVREGMISLRETNNYKFVHDRIKQAVYALIPDEEKQPVHLEIGKLLLHNIPQEEEITRIFDIVNHLNVSCSLIVDPNEKIECAQLNLKAGQKAKSSAAYTPAFKYFQAGIKLLPDNRWQAEYDLTLLLYTKAVETAYLSGNFEEMNRLADTVLQYANTVLDKVDVYDVKIQASIAQNHLQEAIRIARYVLGLLDIRFPELPRKRHFLLELLKTTFALAGKHIEDIINLPKATDPVKKAAGRILYSFSSAAYFTVPELSVLVTLKSVSLSLKYGNAPESPYAYSDYALFLCGVLGDIETGYQFGELALKLLEKFDVGDYNVKTRFTVTVLIKHWKHHLKEALSPLPEIYQCGLDTGDLEFAALSIFAYSSCFIARKLSELERELSVSCGILGKLKQKTVLNLLNMVHQFVLNLIGRSSDPCQLRGDAYDEQTMFPLHIKANDRTAIFSLYYCKSILCYLFESYPEALESANRAAKELNAVISTPLVPIFYFYDSLIRLALYGTATRWEQWYYRRKVWRNQRKMKKWAKHAPMNYLHKYCLVEAERCRVLGKDRQTSEYYDKAIELARENEYLNEEALANELAARFWLSKGKKKFAKLYMTEAYNCYQRWGAVAKVEDLEDKYPNLIKRRSTKDQLVTTRFNRTPDEIGEAVGFDRAAALDMITVTKASQAISREIQLEKLLSEMMAIIIENAGAQKGFLILQKKGQLYIEAAATGDPTKISVLQSIPVEESGELSLSIVHYVVRIGESAILYDATQEGHFTHDQYIVQHQPKSILCAPLRHKDEVSGVVYLENNLATHAFTKEHLTVIQILLTQAAISLENARLYAAMEIEVTERKQMELALKEERASLAQKVEERTTELSKANTELSRAIRLKDEFLATISHELRTPLHVILGMAEILLEGIHGTLNDKVCKSIRQIEKSGRHLLRLITDILDLSKISVGKMELNLEPVPVEAICQASLVFIKQQAQKKQIKILSTYDHGVMTVHADELRLKQVLVNLLTNAIKFTPKGGTIGLEVTGETDDHTIRFIIWDTGIGIASEDMKRLFQPFVQLDAGLSRKYEGAGLGLSLVSRLVDLHGGSISVESEIDKGSRFTVSLPWKKSGDGEMGREGVWERGSMGERESTDNAPHLPISPSPHLPISPIRTILIADDNEGTIQTLSEYFITKGYRVTTARDGKEAVIRTKEDHPDLILMDIQMPEMSGLEAIRQIRELTTHNPQLATRLPIIALTALAMPKDREKCLAAGADEYLSKPVSFRRLTDAIENLLPRKE